MALNQRIAVAAQNAAADAVTALIGASGFLDIYSGTQPTNPDTALGAQVRLAHLALAADAFANAASGTASANAIADDTAADATGTASWGTFTTSAGTRIIDFSVGTSGANLNLNTVAIVAGATISVTGYDFSVPMQGS